VMVPGMVLKVGLSRCCERRAELYAADKPWFDGVAQRDNDLLTAPSCPIPDRRRSARSQMVAGRLVRGFSTEIFYQF
jgi:hypothetical protein